MQTILSLVEAEEGVAVVPASISNLRSDGVQFVRLVPDLYLDLIVAWRLGAPSVVLRTFLDFLSANMDAIRAKANLLYLPSPGSSHNSFLRRAKLPSCRPLGSSSTSRREQAVSSARLNRERDIFLPSLASPHTNPFLARRFSALACFSLDLQIQ